MLFSQKTESSSKETAQRTLRASGAEIRVRRIEGIEQLMALYEQLGHPGQASLSQVARQVRQDMSSRSSLDSLIELTGGDPARTSVVLSYVTAWAQSEGHDADVALSHSYQDQLHTQHAGPVQAGMNIARGLSTISDDASLRQAVRTLYYANVVRRQSPAIIMQALLGMFGDKGFSVGLKMMSRALADDMAAQRPSLPTNKLRAVMLGLQSCRQLGSVLNSCRRFIEQMPRHEKSIELAAVSLLQRLLGYASEGIDLRESQSLGRDLGATNPDSHLLMLNRVYPLIQRLPLAIWCDQRNRQDTLRFLMGLMDELTQSEGLVPQAFGYSSIVK